MMDQKSGLSQPSSLSRVSWVDIAKGMSIFLVVMMHSTLGVQNAVGEMSWMGAIVEFARPFRIPAFMLISGLFLHRSIDSNWSAFLDRKIIHFVYFYVLWVTIQFAIKAPAWMGEGQSVAQVVMVYLTAFVQPFGTLWFIYMLPIFYFATRMVRNVDWKWVMAAAVILQILPIDTGSILIDQFAERYVFFFMGYQFYGRFFAWAEFAGKKWAIMTLFIGFWALANAIMTAQLTPQSLLDFVVTSNAGPIGKFSDLPVISLVLGIAGIFAMIGVASIIMRIKWLGFMRWVGEHSIVIYLAFFLPMAISRILLLKFAGGMLATGTIAALVTLSAACGPIVFYWLVQKTGWGMFLFKRPEMARLKTNDRNLAPKMQPAE